MQGLTFNIYGFCPFKETKSIKGLTRTVLIVEANGMSQEWGSQPVDFNQEPKKVFVNYLIWTSKIVEESLFMGGRVSLAVRAMRGLIAKLDEKSKEKLKPQLDRLLEIESNMLTLNSRTDLEQIFSEILSYLHESYLKEVNFARPTYSPQRLDLP